MSQYELMSLICCLKTQIKSSYKFIFILFIFDQRIVNLPKYLFLRAIGIILSGGIILQGGGIFWREIVELLAGINRRENCCSRYIFGGIFS